MRVPATFPPPSDQAKFDELEKQVVEMNTNGQALNRNYNQLVELKCVLEKDEVFFRQVKSSPQLGLSPSDFPFSPVKKISCAKKMQRLLLRKVDREV